MSSYDLERIQLPVLTGATLKLFARLLRAPLIGKPLLNKLVADVGIPELLSAELSVDPTFRPLIPGAPPNVTGTPSSDLPNATGLASIRDYQRAYRRGAATPSEVAEATLTAIEESNGGDRPLRAIIACQKEDVRRQAKAASQRHADGKPRGPLDGVPIAIKDELDMVPYPTSVGTSYLGSSPATTDATVVKRLRDAGAVLIGKANMYELGTSPESHNMHHGVVRNPYNPAYQSGGSSSGSAAAVAAGLCPMAIGADGGGSIRVPAAFCGVVGLKATYGRFSKHGAAPLCWSLAHIGPIAATTEDVALSYEIAAGADPKDPTSEFQPAPALGDWAQNDLKGIRLGVFRPWFEHAAPDIVSACEVMLGKLQSAGAELCEIEIPQLNLMRIAHVVTILSEMACAMQPHAAHFTRHSPSVQVNLLAGKEFKARHYVMAQQVRTIALRTSAEVFEKVDAIITPTTAITAPAIPESSTHVGWSNITNVTEIMRFIFPGNLTGLPGISFPVGYDRGGLPVGMQAMARHWHEHLLLRIAWVAEQNFERQLPDLHFRALPVTA